MFGYIIADRSLLDEEQRSRYGSCYCGLCRELQKRHGFLGRMTLNYDMTFLVLVLSSLYEPEEDSGMARCPVHPLKKRPYFSTEFTGYAADLNLLLAWWKALDDWQDEKKPGALLLHRALSGRCRKLEERYPRQSAAIRDCLKSIQRYETGEEVSADRAADCFGDLMGAIFAAKETDHWTPTLERLGKGLGRFIYIMDACIDYEEDRRKGRPNPLLALDCGDRDREGDTELLQMLLSEGVEAFERLPLEQDLPLMRNILYAGVWQKYNQAFSRRDKQGNDKKEETK